MAVSENSATQVTNYPYTWRHCQGIDQHVLKLVAELCETLLELNWRQEYPALVGQNVRSGQPKTVAFNSFGSADNMEPNRCSSIFLTQMRTRVFA